MKSSIRLSLVTTGWIFLFAGGCAPGNTAATTDGGVDAIAKPDIEVPDAYIPTLDGGSSAYQVPEHTLIAENARAPSVTTDSYGNLHIAYLCHCDPQAAGNTATVGCDRICYSRVDCNGVEQVVGPDAGIGGSGWWGNFISAQIHLDEQDNVFVLKDISSKQQFHHQVEPNSVHRFDESTNSFVNIEHTFETVAMLPHAGHVYLVTKRDEEQEGENGVFIKVIDYAGNEVTAKTRLFETIYGASLFVGGMVLDKNGQLHIMFRIDDCSDGGETDTKEIIYDPSIGSVIDTKSVTHARTGDHHNIAVGGTDGDLMAATAPYAWSKGIYVALRRLSQSSWSRQADSDSAPYYFADNPRVFWLGDAHHTVDRFNPEVAVDKYDRVFVAFGGVNEEIASGQRYDFHVCHYRGPCDCTAEEAPCSHSVNAYYFIVYENGAVDPITLIRPGSTYENFQGYGEGTVELTPAWDQGVFAVYEHLAHFDGGSFDIYLTPVGGAATACGAPVVE
jgi:hypothetical protein